MSKDQYTVHDSPEMKPKTIDIALKFKDRNTVYQIIGRRYENSAREYVDELVKQEEAEFNTRIESIEYWVNVKADK